MDKRSKLMAAAKLELAKRDRKAQYKEDFEAFAKDNIQIIHKEAGVGYVTFDMNDPQRHVHEKIEEQRKDTGKVRVIILKARQQGFSTYCAARTFWRITNEQNYKAALLAHDQPTTDALFRMTKQLYTRQPEENRQEVSNFNSRNLVFPEISCEYSIHTAGSPNAGRGTTPYILHASEVAFWGNKAEEILAGLFQGVPQSDGTEIILESTANGAIGEFFRLWQEAKAGRGSFIAIFIPWYMSSEYRAEAPDDFEITPEEEELVEAYGLDNDQLYWRRLKISDTGEEKFKQEYPATDEEAFLRSGSTVFDVSSIDYNDVSSPTTNEVYDPAPRCSFDHDPHGHLHTWAYPQDSGEYIVGADVGYGVGQDYSVAVVMTKDKEIVAVYRNNQIKPDEFGEMLYYLGQRYNNALIVCERNGPGNASNQVLEQKGYINIYYETAAAKNNDGPKSRAGFTTSMSSKPAIISGLGEVLRKKSVKIPMSTIIDELKNYIILESGRLEAAGKHHDDSVIATALCIEGLRTHGDQLSKKVNWRQWDQYTQANDDIKWF